MLIIASNDNIGEPGVAQIDGTRRLTVNWENPPGEIENAEFSALASLIISAAMQGPKTGAPSLPRIIGLTGVMGSGKSTVAALLGMVGYHEKNFAYPLRVEVDSVVRTEGLAAPWIHEAAVSLATWDQVVCDRESIWRKPTSEAARLVLQRYGTEYRRAQDEDYWVKQLAETIEPTESYVIGDLRFANEAAWIKAQGGVVWEVRRGVKPPATHASEELNFPVDGVIHNNGSISELAAAVRKMLEFHAAVEVPDGPVN